MGDLEIDLHVLFAVAAPEFAEDDRARLTAALRTLARRERERDAPHVHPGRPGARTPIGPQFRELHHTPFAGVAGTSPPGNGLRFSSARTSFTVMAPMLTSSL